MKVVDALGLSFKSSRELNNIIDIKLPVKRPRFTRQEVVVSGESFDVYSRDVIECLRALYGDPKFASELLVRPEKLFADEEKTVRVYTEMNTGNWWWNIQVCGVFLFVTLHETHYRRQH